LIKQNLLLISLSTAFKIFESFSMEIG